VTKISHNIKKNYRVLVVDDDEEVAHSVAAALRRNFQVAVVYSGIEAIKEAHRHPPHIIVLDIIMPGMDGFETCRELRSDPLLVNIPVLFLTALGHPEDRVAGFKAGGDDYLTKPFNLEELQLRIEAIMRRVYQSVQDKASDKIVVNGVELDRQRYQVKTPYKTATLTPVEFELIYYLMNHIGEAFTSERLLQELWDFPSDSGSPDLVRMHIKNLRHKIEVDPRKPKIIITIPRRGYTVGD
jgi:DNA-binding response OmpR family regulator